VLGGNGLDGIKVAACGEKNGGENRSERLRRWRRDVYKGFYAIPKKRPRRKSGEKDMDDRR